MISVLFARHDSNYKNIPDCDVWDISRDARKWPGGTPLIAHPPCRSWGQLRHMSKPRHDEKELALWALQKVRIYGGILEHPKNSSLWSLSGFCAPGVIDTSGGFLFPVLQSDFGHLADKPTFLYIVGCLPALIPDFPLNLNYSTHIVGTPGRRKDGTRLKKGDYGYRPEVSKCDREHTPMSLCQWLVDIANHVGYHWD